MENKLIVGYSPQDERRIEIHLLKLLPCIDPQEYALVGGLAINYHLSNHGVTVPTRSFNDLDVIAKRPESIRPEAGRIFLASHYHPGSESVPFYIALVDPQTRIKVDIFGWDPPPTKLIYVKFGEYVIPLVGVESQLVKTVFDLQRLSPDKKVDPKQFRDARELWSIAGIKEASRIWRSRYADKYNLGLEEALIRAESIKSEHPDWVKTKPFHKLDVYSCSECEPNNGRFQLTPLEEIYRILGYIE